MNIQSALARFWGGNGWAVHRDDWTVTLGNFLEGRPTLPPSRRGDFIPVFEEQPTTVIAYRLEGDRILECSEFSVGVSRRTLWAFFEMREGDGDALAGL